MKNIFKNNNLTFECKDHSLIVEGDKLLYTSSDGKISVNLKYSEIGSILPMRYCNSNQSYILIFRNHNGKNLHEITTDTVVRNFDHNISETKSILVAYAACKLTSDFPNNLDTLDLVLATSLKEKQIRLFQGVISGTKHKIALNEIRRVKCVTNGTLSNLAIYTKDKGGLFDMPDMTIPLNEVTLPLLEAVMTRNTGKGIDFSRGDGFQQKTSEFMIIRYLDSSFFIDDDKTFKDEWQQVAYDRIKSYGYDIEDLEIIKL